MILNGMVVQIGGQTWNQDLKTHVYLHSSGPGAGGCYLGLSIIRISVLQHFVLLVQWLWPSRQMLQFSVPSQLLFE